LDDLYNHLKVYESEVQKKSEPNSQNMDFISSAKHSSGNEEVNIASISTASTNVSTASANIGVASISQDTACAYIASQSSDVTGFAKSKVECFNFHKMGHFIRECGAPRSQDRGRRDSCRQGFKVEEQAPKALMEIDGAGWDWSYIANDEENHALANDSPTKSKTDKVETAKKPPVKYAEQYRKPTKKPNVRGNQRNWNNLKPHHLGNISYLSDYEPFDRGYVSFGQGGCKITGKGTIKTECIVLGQNFKLSDNDNMLLRTPRQHNRYSIDLNNIVPHKDLTCLVAKASVDEGMIWHRRLEGKSCKGLSLLILEAFTELV
nr:hypothetical protein [Tanacetum cinerariifolium]